VVELPHGGSTIAAKVWRWLLKSEARDSRSTSGLIHQRSGGDDHAFTPTAGLSRWRYRSSEKEKRFSTAFSASVKRAKNTLADSVVYPLVYPLIIKKHKQPIKTITYILCSNDCVHQTPVSDLRKKKRNKQKARLVRAFCFLAFHAERQPPPTAEPDAGLLERSQIDAMLTAPLWRVGTIPTQ